MVEDSPPPYEGLDNLRWQATPTIRRRSAPTSEAYVGLTSTRGRRPEEMRSAWLRTDPSLESVQRDVAANYLQRDAARFGLFDVAVKEALE